MDYTLKLENITKTFNKNTPNEKIALSNLNLSLKKGDFITIIGSNGAGKSSLFNIIGGTFFADSGKILLNNKDITKVSDFKRAKDIGRVFQNPLLGTAPNMTIEENLTLAYSRKSNPSFFALNKKNTSFFKEIISTLNMGLEKRMKTPVGQLSGGQRQAVTLLMCTISSPELLLLDEHTAALDPATSEKILKITQQIVKKNNITTLMITHDINAALKLGNRTVMMSNGNIVLDIFGEELKEMTPQKLLTYYSNSGIISDRTLFSI